MEEKKENKMEEKTKEEIERIVKDGKFINDNNMLSNDNKRLTWIQN